MNFAWPTARIAVIGADGAAQLLVKRFPDPTAPEVQKIKADFIEGYKPEPGDPLHRRRARLHRRGHRAAPDAVCILRSAMRLLRTSRFSACSASPA